MRRMEVFHRGSRVSRFGGTLLALSFLLLTPGVVRAQGGANSGPPDDSSRDRSGAASESRSSQVVYGRFAEGSGFGFPDALQRHLVSSFSVGQTFESGISNGSLADASDTNTDVSASFAYDLPRSRSHYLFDYRVSGRHYRRNSNLDVITHDVGLSQSWQITRRLGWNLGYRYSFTPDYAGQLLGEGVARRMTFVNPIPGAGLGGPGFSSAALSPTNGFETARSVRMSNSATAGLNYMASPRSNLFFQGSYQRERFQDGNLFGSNGYSLSGGTSRTLTPKTSLGVSYQFGNFQQSGSVDVVRNHGLSASLTRQLTNRVRFTVSFGPSWVQSEGREVVPLSPVLFNLLGRTALIRPTALSFFSWVGSASLDTDWQWQGVNFGLFFDRSVSNVEGLGLPAHRQAAGINLSKQITRRTGFSASISYQQNKLIGIQDPGRLDQAALSASLTRRLTPGMDFLFFCNYSRQITEAEENFRLNHGQFGISFLFHLPRISGS